MNPTFSVFNLAALLPKCFLVVSASCLYCIILFLPTAHKAVGDALLQEAGKHLFINFNNNGVESMQEELSLVYLWLVTPLFFPNPKSHDK